MGSDGRPQPAHVLYQHVARANHLILAGPPRQLADRLDRLIDAGRATRITAALQSAESAQGQFRVKRDIRSRAPRPLPALSTFAESHRLQRKRSKDRVRIVQFQRVKLRQREARLLKASRRRQLDRLQIQQIGAVLQHQAVSRNSAAADRDRIGYHVSRALGIDEHNSGRAIAIGRAVKQADRFRDHRRLGECARPQLIAEHRKAIA